MFAITGVSAGIAFAFLTPPMEVPDEGSHVTRAVAAAEGYVRPVDVGDALGAYIPAAIVTFTRDPTPANASASVDSRAEKVGLPNTAVYSPVPYLPQMVAVAAARVLHLRAGQMFYLGRVLAVLAWAGLTWLAIRIAPTGGWTFLAVGLIPIGVYEAASWSSDPMSNAVCFLAVALYLRFHSQSTPLRRRDLAAMFGVAAALALVKIPDVLVAGLFLLLPARAFATARRRAGVLVAFGLWTAAIAGWWLSGVRTFSRFGPGAERSQLHDLLIHPARFAVALWNTYLGQAGDYLYLGTASLGPLSYSAPYWAVIVTYLAVAASFLILRPVPMDGVRKLGVAAVAAAMFLAVNASLFIAWTQPGTRHIEGVQFRYFLTLPIVLIPLFAGLRREPERARRWQPVTIVSASAVVLVASLLATHAHYVR